MLTKIDKKEHAIQFFYFINTTGGRYVTPDATAQFLMHEAGSKRCGDMDVPFSGKEWWRVNSRNTHVMLSEAAFYDYYRQNKNDEHGMWPGYFARQIYTPFEITDELSHSSNPNKRALIADNLATPESILTRLSKDENEHTRKTAEANLNSEANGRLREILKDFP